MSDLLDDVEALADRVRTANASAKFGHPKYTGSIDSQSLMRLLNGIKWMAAELRERRAADLSNEDREALRYLADRSRCDRPGCTDVLCRDLDAGLAVLDRLLREAGGGK